MIQTTDLDYCWCCHIDFAPKGQAQKELHHIIPRAYGGSDGPMVSICDTCHTRLHKIATCLYSKQPYFHLLQGLDQESIKRVLYLATCVVNAKQATENDPNKKVMVVLSLTGQEGQKIDQLKKTLRLTSREQVIKYALASLYKKHFIS